MSTSKGTVFSPIRIEGVEETPAEPVGFVRIIYALICNNDQ
jgi:hypothetical protein